MGALVATTAMFLPSFLFILVGTPTLKRLRDRPRVNIFLAGVLAGVPGAVAGTAMSLTLESFRTGTPMIQLSLFVSAIWLSLRHRVKPMQLISLALMIGIVMELLG